ncbi:NAD(P)H-binding protein [Salinimicrobium flavum]|uniref:NAD(P)H-binding protein n=1 Tax=Salinimicrobium flavum TaxID=1737065 RepID=A0ABW5IUZ0_9FLAO
MKTAIILGATGLTGSILLDRLLRDVRYSRIKLFSRRSVGFQHPKLEEHLIDLFELEKYAEMFTGDEVFVCIGTTKKKTPNEEVYKKVDYGIPVTAARLAKKNDIEKFLVISALGADPESKFFYNRIKGEMEREVLEQDIPETYIFQPSLIGGHREEKRTFEALWKKVMKLGNHLLIGKFRKYRSIHPKTIAAAMIKVANKGYKKKRIESHKIKKIVRE